MDDHVILDDAETALLAALHALGLGPMEAISAAAAAESATMSHGFEPARLDAAVVSLAEKGLIDLLEEGRVRLTRKGFIEAHDSAAALEAGLSGGL